MIDLTIAFPGLVCAQPADGAYRAGTTRLPEPATTHQVSGLAGGALRFNAAAGGIRLRDDRNAVPTDVAFIAYQTEGAEAATRPMTFVSLGGPGMASAEAADGGSGTVAGAGGSGDRRPFGIAGADSERRHVTAAMRRSIQGSTP